MDVINFSLAISLDFGFTRLLPGVNVCFDSGPGGLLPWKKGENKRQEQKVLALYFISIYVVFMF